MGLEWSLSLGVRRCTRPGWSQGLSRNRFDRTIAANGLTGPPVGRILRDTFPMRLQLPAALDPFPLHRDKVERAYRFGVSVPEILGMAIAGSFAAGGSDVYSDVDLRIVVEDAALDAVFARRHEMAQSCGDMVAGFTGEHVGDPYLLIVLYDDLVHVDFDFTRLSDLTADNQGRPCLVLWERGDQLSGRLRGDYHPDRRGELAWIESRFWTWMWYVQSKILRGELYEALDGLQYMRSRVLFPLLAISRGVHPAGSRRAEVLVGDMGATFAGTVAALERPSLMLALTRTAELYRLLGDPLLERLGVPRQDRARRVALSALDGGINYKPN
jgi:hypothetical protein